jgi:hypothetical protein
MAIGNSGGGTLTLMLSALCSEQLAGVSSSGYPSTFEFIARKEKRHCHCNIIPHIVGELEMWQVLGCFAPKPMFLFQGKGDPLFPPDLFYHTARKVRSVYEHGDAAEQLTIQVFEGEHSWDAARRRALTMFVCRVIGVVYDENLVTEPSAQPSPELCFETWPRDAKSTDEVAGLLSGGSLPINGGSSKGVSKAENLWDVYEAPRLTDGTANPLLRGEARQILAQFEAYLKR